MHSLPVIRKQSRPIQARLGKPLGDSQVEAKGGLKLTRATAVYFVQISD